MTRAALALPRLADLTGVRVLAPPGLSQASRLVQIHTALPEAALLVESLQGREAVNEGFHFDLRCVSTSAHLELKRLIGEQVSLRLQRADGGWRTWHGYVTQAANLGADGGLARFGLRVESFFAFLQLRRDSFLFQDCHALQIIEDVLADHPQARWRVDLPPDRLQALRVREICTQHDETDLDFILRLLAEEGLSYGFEHDAEDASGGPSEATQARHCLVILDATTQPDRLGPDLGRLRYSRPDLRADRPPNGLPDALAPAADSLGLSPLGQAQDTLTAWIATRELAPTGVTLAHWIPGWLASSTATEARAQTEGAPGADPAAHPSADPAPLPTLEHFRAGSPGAPSRQDAHTHAEARQLLHALRLPAHRHQGRGSVRTLAAGCRFTLADHPHLSGHGYTVLAVEHEAANNLGSAATGLPLSVQPQTGRLPDTASHYQQRIEAVPEGTPIAPPPRARPMAHGVQLARVVGLAGEPVFTDRELRIKIQFPWQRGSAPLPGGLAHDGPSVDPEGNAPGDERSGFWVRVAQASAGADWGSAFVPRVGAEVLVAFADGDLDQPLVVGQVHTPQQPPPWPAGAHAQAYGGANHPGTLSGVRSASLDGQGHNEWLLDDSTGQLRMRLRAEGSGLAAGELSLGHLVQQGTDSLRGPWLGSGFYAQTEGWAIVRAERGLLLTTAARRATGAGVLGGQMDSDEARQTLRAAHQAAHALSQAAAHQGALSLTSHDAEQALASHLRAIDPQQDGQLPGVAASPPVEAFARPLVHLDAASTLAWSTDGPLASYSGQDFSLSSLGDLHQAASHTYASVSGATTSLYTHEGGIRLVAAAGPVSVRAHTDAQDLLAHDGLCVISHTDDIVIQAAQRIELHAGGCSVVLDGGDITFSCPGTWTVKAASHDWGGAGGQGAQLPELPAGHMAPIPPTKPHLLSPKPQQFSERLLVFDPLTGSARQVPFQFVYRQAIAERGKTDIAGYSPRHMRPMQEEGFALIGPSAPWTVAYQTDDGVQPPPVFHLEEDAEEASDEPASNHDTRKPT